MKPNMDKRKRWLPGTELWLAIIFVIYRVCKRVAIGLGGTSETCLPLGSAHFRRQEVTRHTHYKDILMDFVYRSFEGRGGAFNIL